MNDGIVECCNPGHKKQKKYILKNVVATVLDEAVRPEKVKKGDIVLVDCFGAGLTHGSVLMRQQLKGG